MSEKTAHKLDVLSKFFDLDEVAGATIHQDYISEYYRVNKLAYSFLHTKEHFVHMGITKDGSEYSEEDLYAHAKEIHKLIARTGASQVLELATGRGGNSAWLAKQNPQVSFVGIDISPTQLVFAKRISKQLDNYTIKQGSFEDLSQFADASFDIVFIIEALCHSNNFESVFAEVSRVLRTGGKFLVYDGYRERESADLNEQEIQLMRLLEVGVAVDHFNEIDHFLSAAQKAKLQVETNEDLSMFVLPTMRRFEKKAKLFFKLGPATKLLLRVFPAKFSFNIISGYLFPTLLEEKLFSYRFTVFTKQ
jgi:ubiquinone/menaquinone biosynthesis C-methylase UbiE